METYQENRVEITPKDFFVNLGWLATLYGSVISLLNLLFETINRVFPDLVNQYYMSGSYSGGIRWAIAWLVVVFPVYILLMRYLRKTYITEPAKREIWIRRWFIYLTLFLSSVAVLVDLIVLINSFLGGELTTRFLLKVLATLIVAGAVFGYYFYDLKSEGVSTRMGKWFAISSMIIVIASLVWAFAVIGSPMNERARRFDEQRIQNLQDIQWRITNYWQNNGVLPTSLAKIEDNVGGYKVSVDPETKEVYEYKMTGDKNFQICANYNLEKSANQEILSYSNLPGNDFWSHGKGRTCFDRTIDEKLYPVNPVKLITPVPVR